MNQIQRGPFISNYGIKLHDPLFHYESGIAKMRSLTSKIISGKRVKPKDAEVKVVSVDKEKTAEDKDTVPDGSTKRVDVSYYGNSLFAVSTMLFILLSIARG